MHSNPFKKVSATTANQTAKTIHQTYGEAKSDVVAQLLKQQEGKYQVSNPYAFLSKNNEADLSYLAEKKILYAMANPPTVTTDGEVNVIEKHMDEEISDYSTAKSAVKQSFLGRMVGPAFVTGAMASAAMMFPNAAGAYDKMPTYLGDAGLNPSVIGQ